MATISIKKDCFIISNDANVDVSENETAGSLFDNFVEIFGKSAVGENETNDDQKFGRNIGHRKTKKVDTAVMTVKNWVHDAMLAAMDNVVIPRKEMAMISIAG